MDEPPEPAGNAAAKQVVDEPAGGAAKKKKKKKQKPLAGADNAPLRRRIALARGGARATSSDAAHSEDWAHAFVAACTVAPAAAPPAAAPAHAGSGPWLSVAPTVCARDESLTQAKRVPHRAGQLDQHAVFRNHTDFMERLPRAAQEQGGQAMPALHGRQMHQAAHTAAASSTFFATSSLSSARDNRAPPRKAQPPQRQDSALWDKVNMNTSGLLDEALDSV